MKLISTMVLLLVMFGCDNKTKIVEPQVNSVTQEVVVPAQQEVEVVLEAQVEPQIQELSPIIETYQVNEAPKNIEMSPVIMETSPVIIDAPPPQINEEITYNSKPNYGQEEEVRTVSEAPQLPAGYKEETKLVSVKGNIPKSCQMWTDGCNTCTRAGKRKANCTLYKCQSNIKFSCLQWN